MFGFYLFILIAPYGGEGLFKDPDIFWHITVGRDIWQSGAFPHVDPYSMTFQGQPWIANEWLGGVLFYGAYASGGWRGVVLLSACILALSYALLFFVLARKMRLTVAAGLATAAFIFSIDQFNLRPYVFAYPLIVIWVAGLLDALENDRPPEPSAFADHGAMGQSPRELYLRLGDRGGDWRSKQFSPLLPRCGCAPPCAGSSFFLRRFALPA